MGDARSARGLLRAVWVIAPSSLSGEDSCFVRKPEGRVPN